MTLQARLDGERCRPSNIVDHNRSIVEAMATEKDVSAHESEGKVQKQTFGQKMKRSCARFWWLYLFVFIAIVLVVVLPM